ncbi:MAG: HAD-IB family hydrolase [Actinomycetota bacterium]|nr:HAD-IB family hydrolase [Actinomycetota bacterium]MDP9474574.1 HAD-IB family hydrolase [Actinomycetota bacterium]MDP9487270.1 HAD-IB family hydrolase [Actinomycetota bacterium]
MALALFDLDNTLLAGDSEHAWGEFLIEIGAVDEEEFRAENDRLYGEYLAGTLDIYEQIRHQLRPLMEHPPEKLRRWHEEFMRTRIEPMITPAAMALVEKHRVARDEPAIITASNDFVTGPIAEYFGVPNLLAIELECVDGRYTGRVSSTPTFKEGKVTRLKEWLRGSGRTLEGSYFYSDSHNDLPLLRQVDHPVAVNADPILLAHAEASGWPILDLHGSP